MIPISPRQRIVFASLAALTAVSCSTVIPKKKNGDAPPQSGASASVTVTEAPPPTAPAASPSAAPQASAQALAEENRELKGQVNSLVARLEAMESRLSAMAEKVEASKRQAPPQPGRIVPHSGSSGGTPVEAAESASDPAAGFVNDNAVQSYRKSMVLFRAGRYTDAVLSFTAFLEKYPDHPLAGAAQFHVGESYLLMKEYKLAVQEFQRVLTSYDRSSHVAQTLREMAEAEDALKRTEDAARHRQLLMSLFPHSPFAITVAASEAAAPAEGGATPKAPGAPAAPVKAPKFDEPPAESIPPTAPAAESHSATEKE